MFTRPAISFTESFDFCIDTFFHANKNVVLGEVFQYILKPSTQPKPAVCGNFKTRSKVLLINNNLILIYWDYGRVWEICALVEIGNADHLSKLGNYADNKIKNNT